MVASLEVATGGGERMRDAIHTSLTQPNTGGNGCKAGASPDGHMLYARKIRATARIGGKRGITSGLR